MRSSRCDRPSSRRTTRARSCEHRRRQRNHVAQLREVIEHTRDPAGLTQLHYALAKELEDLADFDGAFASLERGAAAKRKHMQYSVATDLAIMEKIREVYGPGLFDGAYCRLRRGRPDLHPGHAAHGHDARRTDSR